MNTLKKLLSIVGLWLAMSMAAHAGTVTYVYTDNQGTPLAEADAQGNVTATFDYRPYGAQALGTPPKGPGYTGHVNDPDTGLVYMQARYYDPSIGRFISLDPEKPNPGDPFKFGRYAYAGGNPVKYTDPDGRAFGIDDLIGFGAGALIGMAVEVGKDAIVSGRLPTGGEVAGSLVSGGIVGLGVVNAPETGGVSFAAAVGGGASLAGNTVQQSIDVADGAQEKYSVKSAVISTTVGAVSGGAAELVLPGLSVSGVTSGKNSAQAVYKSTATKIANGNAANMSMKTAVKGVVASRVEGAYKDAGTTAVDGAKSAACDAAKGGCE